MGFRVALGAFSLHVSRPKSLEAKEPLAKSVSSGTKMCTVDARISDVTDGTSDTARAGRARCDGDEPFGWCRPERRSGGQH
jgi:hypothetical protein